MPLYDYECRNCGHRVEVLHGVNAVGPTACEQCGGAMRKLFSMPAIVFKGSGFAKKDFRDSRSNAKQGKEPAKAEAGDGSSQFGRRAQTRLGRRHEVERRSRQVHQRQGFVVDQGSRRIVVTDEEPTTSEARSPPPPAQSVTGWRRTVDRQVQHVTGNVVVHTALRVMETANEAGAPLFAAALAFTTLFAVVPLFLLLAGVLGWLIQDAVQRSNLLDQLVGYFPPLKDAMSTSLENVVEQRGTLSFVGLVGLLWGTSAYYGALDEVMRRIFSAKHARGFIEQRLRGIITVVVLLALMLGTIGLSSLFAILGARLGVAPVVPILIPTVALTLIVAVVFAAYVLVPASPPSWRAALPPAIVAGVGIGILTNVFSLLTPWLIGGLLAFGVIATVFGALIWLSLSYQILLYGAAWARIRRDAEARKAVEAASPTPFAD